jgi:GNAT superfamily N-acetyltransferase
MRPRIGPMPRSIRHCTVSTLIREGLRIYCLTGNQVVMRWATSSAISSQLSIESFGRHAAHDQVSTTSLVGSEQRFRPTLHSASQEGPAATRFRSSCSARLGVHRDEQGHGLGRALLTEVPLRTSEAADTVVSARAP